MLQVSRRNASDGEAFGFVAADIVKSDTALANVTGLTFPTLAGATYQLDATIFSLAAATTTGMTLAVNHSTAVTFIQAGASFFTTATATSTAVASALDAAMTSTDQLTTVSPQRLWAHVVVLTAGTLAVRWAPEAAASATVKRGSFARLTRLA